MTWMVYKGKEFDAPCLLHIHGEVRNERRFWFDKSVAYVNFYATIISALMSAFIFGLTQVDTLGQFKYFLLVLTIIPIFLSFYAKRAIKICYRNFLENTAIMAKIELYLGLYSALKLTNLDKNIFEDDKYLNTKRHYDNLKRFRRSEDFIEDDLEQSNRTYRIKVRVFTLLVILSIVMLIGALILMIYPLFCGNSNSVEQISII